MARHHSKQHSQKQPVRKVVTRAAVQSKEREAIEVPAGTEGAIAVKQEDGSEKFFVVHFKTVTPEVAHYVACGPTTTRGRENKPENMAPKGKAGSKTGPQSGGKK